MKLILITTLILVSCGKKVIDKKDPVHPMDVVATRESAHPIFLASDSNKSGCSTASFDDSERNLPLYLFLRGESLNEPRMFTGLLDGLFVRDIGAQAIGQSHFGEKVTYSYVSVDDVVNARKSIENAASNVTVCPDAGPYGRSTVESAALNATFYIAKVNRKIKDLLPGIKISPISVEITPSIKKSLSVITKGEVVFNYETFLTDNAYYAAADKSITFLPHSEEVREAGFTMNFWEIPMVPSHEYGHHIFESLYATNGQSNSSKNCFGRLNVTKNYAVKIEGARAVTNDDVLSALNEGFADLVSYYSLDNQERGLKGVPCMQIARDVGSRTFTNGQPKSFTSSALASFFSEKENESSESCAIPDFQDIHIMGAVFANGFDRFLSHSVSTKDQRLSIVLSWLQEMKKKQTDMAQLTPTDYLRSSFLLMMDVVNDKTDQKMDNDECTIAMDVFPTIESSISTCLPPL